MFKGTLVMIRLNSKLPGVNEFRKQRALHLHVYVSAVLQV